MSREEVCEDIATRTTVAMVICAVGVVSIFAVIGLAMLKTIALPGHSALLLIMLAVVLYSCLPFLSIYGTYKYAECLIDDLMREINEWLQRGGE